MFAEHPTTLISTTLPGTSLAGAADVFAQVPGRDVPQGWVGFAAVAVGAVMGAVALLKRSRDGSLARKQQHTDPSSRWDASGRGTRRDLADGPLR